MAKTNKQKPTAIATGGNAGFVYVCSHLDRGVCFDFPNKRKVRIAGRNDSLRGKEKGILAKNGGVFTKIAEADWEAIKTTFAKHPLIERGVLYAEKDEASAKDAIKEKAELKTGLEPIDVSKTQTTAAKRA